MVRYWQPGYLRAPRVKRVETCMGMGMGMDRRKGMLAIFLDLTIYFLRTSITKAISDYWMAEIREMR